MKTFIAVVFLTVFFGLTFLFDSKAETENKSTCNLIVPNRVQTPLYSVTEVQCRAHCSSTLNSRWRDWIGQTYFCGFAGKVLEKKYILETGPRTHRGMGYPALNPRSAESAHVFFFHNGACANSLCSLSTESDGKVVVTNAQGEQATGLLRGSDRLHIQKWKLDGKVVSVAGIPTRIRWTNGTIWSR